MRELLASLSSARKKFMDGFGWSKELFDYVVSKDPSPTKKYLEWICGYIQGRVPTHIKDDGGKSLVREIGFTSVTDELADLILRLHDLVEAHLLPGFNINAIPREFLPLKMFVEQAEAKSATHSMGLNKLKKGEDYEKVWEGPEWVAFLIKTFKASRVLGSGTPWCVVANEGHFDSYTQGNRVFVFVINKNNFKDKYAIRVKINPMHQNVYPFQRDPSDSVAGWRLLEITTVENKEIPLSVFLERKISFDFSGVFQPLVVRKVPASAVLEDIARQLSIKNLTVTQEKDKHVVRWEGELKISANFLSYIQPKLVPELFTEKSGVVFEGEVECFHIPSTVDIFDFSVFKSMGSPTSVIFSGNPGDLIHILNYNLTNRLSTFLLSYAHFQKSNVSVRSFVTKLVHSVFSGGPEFVVEDRPLPKEFEWDDCKGPVSVRLEGSDSVITLRSNDLPIEGVVVRGSAYSLKIQNYSLHPLAFSSPNLSLSVLVFRSEGAPVNTLVVKSTDFFIYNCLGDPDFSFLPKMKVKSFNLVNHKLSDMRYLPDGSSNIDFYATDVSSFIFRLPTMKDSNSTILIYLTQTSKELLFSDPPECIPNPTFNSNLVFVASHFVSMTMVTCVSMFGKFLDSLQKRGCLPKQCSIRTATGSQTFDAHEVLEEWRKLLSGLR